MKAKSKQSSEQNQIQAKAYRYYVMGLNCQEIGKLLDLSARTVERYMQIGGWKEAVQCKTIKAKVYELRQSGKTYAEIASMLQVSQGTVFNYLKQYRANKEVLQAD